jgi:MYXO-CTERM domain-containing protein
MRARTFACALTSAGVVVPAAFSTSAFAQPVTAGAVRSYSTPQSIGVEWDVTGDPDHDATVAVRYRRMGATAWNDAMPLFRVDFAGQNMLAGSVMFLASNQQHEVELALSDPDGGGETRSVTVTTLREPVLPTGGRTLHVAPGSGGGDGSQGNPFRGIDAADAAARPGDIVLVHGGDYGGAQRQFDTPGTAGNWVVWQAAPGETPSFDDIRIRGDYIWIEGFEISAPTNALRNEGPSVGAVVKSNRITGCNYCIHLNTGAEGWWISDNTIVGDQVPASGSLSGEGIELAHTGGHTVAYNSVSRAADAVSYPDRNVDIFGNDFFENSDDGIEADSAYANVRIWGNRIHHAHNNGITFQPMNGAPWYVIRNQVIGSNESVLKLRTAVDRVFVAHNTFVSWDQVLVNSVGFIRNMKLRNNLFITVNGGYLWEDTGNPDTPDSWRTDIDYDGFAWPTTASPPLFKWHNVRYDDLAALRAAATNIEQHAVLVPMSCFDTLNVPGPPPAVIPPHHVTLASGCNAIDAGEVLPNVNDGFVGTRPDLGAHERGAPPAHYGPRSGAGGTAGSAGTAGSGGTGGSAGAGGTGGSGAAGGAGTGATAGTGGGSAAAGGATGGGNAGSGTNGTSGGPAAGGSNPASGSASEEESGCGCRSASTRRSGAIAVLVVALGLLVSRRRRALKTR